MRKRDRLSTAPNGRKIARLGIALAALVAATAVAAEGRGTCVRAELDQAVALPDGSTYEPGVVRVCLTREYSPVSGLHEVSIGATRAGMFLSRRTASEGAPGDYDAVLVFGRGSEHLLLLGYAVRNGERMQLYWMRPPGGKRAEREVAALTNGSDIPELLASDPERVLLVNAETR